MSPEESIFLFLEETVAAAGVDDPLDGSAVHPNFYIRISTERGIRIGDSIADIAPRGGEFKEFNVAFPVQIFVRVDGEDFTAARETVRAMGLKVAGAMFDDPTLGGRVCDARIVTASRSWAKVSATPYAVQILQIIIDRFR